MTVADHAEHAPSSISRIIQCPGSRKLCKQFPGIVLDGTREAAIEGETGHWVAARTARGELTPLGTICPTTSLPVTEEMIEGAELWAETIGTPQHIEERLPPSEEFGPNCWGTPDSWKFGPETWPAGLMYTLRVSDYKFGHRYVDVFENWQLVCYACLIIDGVLRLNGLQDQAVKCVFDIVQPRNFTPEGPVRTWSCMASDLRPLRNRIKAAIAASEKDDAPCVVGYECRDCSARAHCGTLQRAAMSAIEESTKITPLVLKPEALGLELRMLERAGMLIKARAAGLREVAMETITSGVMVPGFRTETGLGRQRWKVPMPQVVALEAVIGKKLTEPKAVTPKQAIKLGVPEEVVAMFSETPNGETRLVEDDSTLTRRIFGGAR